MEFSPPKINHNNFQDDLLLFIASSRRFLWLAFAQGGWLQLPRFVVFVQRVSEDDGTIERCDTILEFILSALLW